MRALLACALLFFCVVHLAQVAKGGEVFNFEYKPNPDDPSKVTLPSSDTSMLGAGMTWSHVQNKGVFVTKYPIPMVSWFNLPFELALVYSSQGHTHNALASHWELSIPYIQIHARMGVPRYEGSVLETPGIYSSLDEELVLINSETGEFRPKVDTRFRKYVYSAKTHAFEMQSPDGVVFMFGSTPTAQLSSDHPHTYGWMLSEIRNRFNQRIIFEYSKEHNFPLIHHIRFVTHKNAELYRIVFNYETREDEKTSFRYGFETRIDKRLKNIELYTLPDGEWVNKKRQREITLHYIRSSMDGSSVLERVQHVGFDAQGGRESHPDVSFKTNLELNITPKLVNTAVPLPDPMGRSKPLSIDWNGDGVTDLMSKGDSDHLKVFLQTARRGFTSAMDIQWTGEDVHSQNVQFADVDGDRRVDMIVAPSAHGLYPAGYYRTSQGDRWSQPVPFDHPYDMGNFWKHIFGDLNRDGKVDAVYYGEATGLNLYFQTRVGSFQLSHFYRESSDYPQILDYGWHHKWLQLADINGDGLSDLAALRILPSDLPNGQVQMCYSEGTGYGFVPEKKCKGANASSESEAVLEDVFRRKNKHWSLMDITGDGRADLVAFSNTRLVIYTQLPTKFSDGRTISFKEDFIKPGDTTRVLFWDANANGTRDVVVARKGLDDAHYTYHYIDFYNEDGAQGLLTEVSNGYGLTYALKFKPSTLACERDSCHLHLPDVFPLLSEIRTRHWQEEAQQEIFHYEDGFYSDKENIFNGFGKVISDLTDPMGSSRRRFVYDNGSTDQNLAGVLLDSFVYDDKTSLKESDTRKYQTIQTNKGYVVRHISSDSISYHDGEEAVGVSNRYELRLHEETHTPKSYLKTSEPKHDSAHRAVQITYLQPSERSWLIQPTELVLNKEPQLRYHWDAETGVMSAMDRWSQYLSPSYLEKLHSTSNLCRYMAAHTTSYEQGWVRTHAFEYSSDSGVASDFYSHSGLHVSLHYPEILYDFQPTQITSEGKDIVSEHQQIVYDWHHGGKVQSYTNSRGLKQRYVYDALSRLSEHYERDDTSSPQERYRYRYAQDADSPFSVITVQTKNMALPTFHLFDPIGRNVAQAIQISDQQYRFLDAQKLSHRGWLLAQYQPFVSHSLQGWKHNDGIPAAKYRYDVLQRLASQVFPNGAQEEYQYKGLTVDKANPRGNVVRKHMNDFQETVGWSYPVEGSTSYQTAISRNALGEIVRLSTGHYPDFQYEYHPQKTLWKASNSLSGDVELGASSDERFSLKIVRDKLEHVSGLTLSSYDSKQRLIEQKRMNCLHSSKQESPQTTVHQLVYGMGESLDGLSDLGLLVRESYETLGYPKITKKYRHDGRDRLSQKIIDVGGQEHGYVQRFDTRDRLVSRNTAGISANYRYTNGIDLDHMSVNDNTVELTHSPEGLLAQERVSDFSARYVYDPQMKWIVSKDASHGNNSIKAYQWNYDAAGNVISESENGALTTYGYDALERLRAINDQTLSYTHSNDLQFDGSKWFLWLPEAVASVLGFQKEERDNDLSFKRIGMHFDDFGHITHFGQSYPRYEYDPEGRLIVAYVSKNEKLVYVYANSHHPVLRQVIRQGKIVRTQVHLDEMGWLDFENKYLHAVLPYSQSGQLWVEGQADSKKSVSVSIPDFRGSPETVLPLDGKPSVERRYDVFGWRAANPEEGLTPGYAGHVDDTLAGVSFARHRVYIPMLRRFASMDPMLFSDPQQLVARPLEYNPYQYSANNPVVYVDPEGEFVPLAVPLILGITTGTSLAISYGIARMVDAINVRAGADSKIHEINEVFKTTAAVAVGVGVGLPHVSVASVGALSGMAVKTGMSVLDAKIQGEGTEGMIRAFGMGMSGGVFAGQVQGFLPGVGMSMVSAGIGNIAMQTMNKAPGESYDWGSVAISAGAGGLGRNLGVGFFGNMKSDFLQGIASSIFSGVANKGGHWLSDNLQK